MRNVGTDITGVANTSHAWGELSTYGGGSGFTTFYSLDDLDYLESQGRLRPAYMFTPMAYSETGDAVSAFQGRRNLDNGNYGIMTPAHMWRPTKSRITWSPASVGIWVYVWDQMFYDIGPDWVGSPYTTPMFSGGVAEFDHRAYLAENYFDGDYQQWDDFGVENDYPNGHPNYQVPIKILSWDVYGYKPSNFYYILDPAHPVVAIGETLAGGPHPNYAIALTLTPPQGAKVYYYVSIQENLGTELDTNEGPYAELPPENTWQEATSNIILPNVWPRMYPSALPAGCTYTYRFYTVNFYAVPIADPSKRTPVFGINYRLFDV